MTDFIDKTFAHKTFNPMVTGLGFTWLPQIAAQEMGSEMVTSGLQVAKQHALLEANGFDASVNVE